MSRNIADIRKDYKKDTLSEKDVLKDPLEQFQKWFNEAINSKVMEPNAMNLATVGKSNMPSSRVVLLKGVEDSGFVFYTNYQSHKGNDLEENPQAALTFFWAELERQVRIQGIVEKVEKQQSETYFKSRPKESQIGAWASPQSAVISSREILEQREADLQKKYKDDPVLPKPEQWGGYILKPLVVEFWQGRASRLHDRIVYVLEKGKWVTKRLAP